MKLLIKSLFIVLLVFVIGAWLLLVQSKPLVEVASHEQVANADKVLSLFEDVRQSLRQRYDAKTLQISHPQADSLVGFAQRAIPAVQAQLTFDKDQAKARISYQLPNYLLGHYLNITATVVPDDKLNIANVSIGGLTLPGNWALSIAEDIANAYTNSQVATAAIAQIQSIKMTDYRIIVNLHPMDSFLNEAKNVETGGNSEQARLMNIRIAHYIRLLDGMYVPPATGKQSSTSLSFYLQGLMEEAQAQSQREGSSATLENEAALLALAAYAGHRQFANFIGDFSFSFDTIPQAKNRPSLANRSDLNLHFIFSAAIKLLSEQGVSIAVGEFKELMDRRSGGSGYSFVDLAADMAGAHFAALAVDPQYARRMQVLLASDANESYFFPGIDGLEEGMNKAEFAKRYGEVDSPRYREVVKDINQRLQQLPISN